MTRYSKSGLGGNKMPYFKAEPRRVTTETALKRAVKGYLALKGWAVWHNLQGLGSYPGLPDLTAVKHDHMGGGGYEARTIWIEVKSAKGKQSPFQRAFQEMIEEAGGEYRVIRSLEDLIDEGF